MKLSRSSKPMADPLSDVLTVLGAKVTRRTRLEAAGQWALEFPALDRLKFVALLRGTGWLMVPERDPQRMNAGDVCLIGRMPYAVASDPALPLSDGQPFMEWPALLDASARMPVIRTEEGTGHDDHDAGN